MAEYELHVNGQAVYRGDSFDYPGEGQYAVTDVTQQAQAAQTAGGALAVGMLEYYHTCTCQGRANGPPTNSSTLAAATAAAATVIHPASVTGLIAGDVINVDTGANLETRTIAAVGTAGATGTGVTLTAALSNAHASGVATVSSNGPSGILARVVVDHADGTHDVFVSDGSWKVTKDTAFTNTTNTQRNSDAGDYVERYDARLELPGWDTAGYDDSAWSTATVIGPHPRPASTTQDRFSHLDGNVSGISYATLHPVSVTTLADGTVVADFGKVISAMPQIHFHSGTAGRALTMQTAYLPVHTTLAAASAAGDTNVKVASTSSLVAGDRITVDSPDPGFPVGDPETRTITAVGTAGATGTGITLDAPLTDPHANGKPVAGTRASTASIDNQGSTMTWFYTEKDGDQTAQAFTYWGWRYLQINAPGPGEALSADDIAAVLQHTDAPADRTATFSSGIPLLDDGFTMMQRSGLWASQETGVDTPTREKGQFLGDGVDYGLANLAASGERNATKRMIREFVYSAGHSWKATSSGYCAAAPCSYPGYGPLSNGRLNAVYPNGDNMRDIPDYNELWPDMVWGYYLASGDRATLASAYPSLQADVSYVHNAQPSSGAAAGLTWLLPGGTGTYQNGIIDWPSRLGYTFTNNGARTIHAAEAVGVYRTTAKAAAAVGDTANAAAYNGYADDLAAQINAKQRIPGDTLYSDGLATNATTTSAATVVGATNVKVASVAPFSVGDTLSINFDNGSLKELATVTSVGTSGSGGTGIGITPALTKAHASGVAIATSSSTQLFPAGTTLAASAAAGDSVVKVASVSGFTSSEGNEANAGPTLIVGTGADREVRRIAAVGTAGAGGTGITLAAPLSAGHATGALVASPSQQAQTFPIFEGVAPKADWGSMADYMAAQGLRSAPMDWGETMESLGLADRPDAIVDMMTRTDRFGPGQVLASGGTWIWEDWTITGSNSMSHGWGARGITSMLKYLLGIDVTSPGAATVSIAPPDKGLDHASGSQWTQRGTVSVSWARAGAGPRVSLDVTVPDNVVATVSLPTTGTARSYTATGDGAPVFAGVANGRETYTVGSGTTHFTVDATPPTTTATTSPAAPNGANGWFTVPVQVTLTAQDDDGSGVASTEYAIDGGSYQPYTAPFTVTGDGVHTVLYRSTDTAGNVEDAKTLTLKIDLTNPTSSASISPPARNGWYASPTVTLTGADGAGSGIDHISYKIDGEATWHTYTAPLTGFSTGNHFVQFQATDVSGRVESTVNLVAFKADSVAPSVNIVHPADGETVPLGKVENASYKCADKESGLDTCTGPVPSGTPFDTSTAGDHTFTVTATDKAGNTTTVTHHYTVQPRG
jgi:hypothetical protein